MGLKFTELKTNCPLSLYFSLSCVPSAGAGIAPLPQVKPGISPAQLQMLRQQQQQAGSPQVKAVSKPQQVRNHSAVLWTYV